MVYTLVIQGDRPGGSVLRNRVREFRELHGLTQGELAIRAGVSERVVTLLETVEGYTPQMRVALRLCGFFNVDLGRLFWIERATPRVDAVATEVA